MNESIIKKTEKREVSDQKWGSLTCLVEEKCYFIDEYTVNPSGIVDIKEEYGITYCIIASGSAEFSSNDGRQVYFKGDKVCFANSNFRVRNCGVIPLKFIKILLKKQQN